MRGLFGALNNASIIYAICLLSVGDAISLTSLSPLVILIFIYIFFNENDFVIHHPMITIKLFLAILICIPGIICIVQPKFIRNIDNKKTDDVNGCIWGLCGSIMTGSIYVTLKKGQDSIHEINVNHWFWSHSIISCILGIIMSYSHLGKLYGDIDPTKYEYHVLLLILMGFLSFCAQFLMSISIQYITPKDAIFCMEILLIIFGYLWQIFAFKQIPKFMTLIGVLLIIICIVFVYLDIHCKIENVMKLRQNLLNKSKIITKRNKDGIKKRNIIRPKFGKSDSDEHGDRRVISGTHPSMLSTRTDSQLTFNMDI